MPDMIRHPVFFWIPAFAGMTTVGYLTAGVIAYSLSSKNHYVILSANNFNQHTLAPPAIELTIKYLLPCPEIKSPIRDGHDDLPTHDLPFHVGIGKPYLAPITNIQYIHV